MASIGAVHDSNRQHASVRRLDTSALLVVALMVVALLFVVRAVVALVRPYALDYGEGIVLDQVARLARLENLYRTDLVDPPYTVMNYPPLYQLVELPFFKLFGPAYWYGRIVSIASVGATAALVGLTVRALLSRRAGLVAALAILAAPPIFVWAALARVDSLALALSWAGLYLVMVRPGAPTMLVALPLVAAVLTKHSYAIAAPAAAAAVYIQRRQPVRALALIAMVFGACGSIFLVFDRVTGGGLFFNLISANAMPFQLRHAAFRFLVSVAPMSIMAVAAVLFVSGIRVASGDPLAPLAVYFVGSLFQAIGSGKIGGDINYFYEFAVACSIGMGVLAGRAVEKDGLLAQLLVVQALFLIALYASIGTRLRFDTGESATRLREIVRATSGPILCDACVGVLPLERRSVYFQPHEMSQLALEGKWDDRFVIDQLRQRRIQLIIQDQTPSELARSWTPAMRQAIATNYREVERLPLAVEEGRVALVLRPR